MVRLYNTPTKKVEQFVPIDPNRITLYTCGPTVYDYPQIGNWLIYIRWDILVRTLTHAGYNVERVMNITDVGHLVSDADEGKDKIEKGAEREGTTAWQIAKQYSDDFLNGMKRLNMITPTYITKATDYIPQQIALIKTLEEKGYTYITSDGIYFDTSKFPSYATFAQLDVKGLAAGARVAVNPEKRTITDFALWKFSPKEGKRDMEWESPWGTGFPGWHLECSAMAINKLGETIDIHTGGIDHIPVHHTNEIAQSEAATGKPFAHYWLHANFLMVNGTKISKSLGNGFTLQDIIQKGYEPAHYRMFVLQSHYRSETNFTWENLEAAKNRLHAWKNSANLRHQAIDVPHDNGRDLLSQASATYLRAVRAAADAVYDDLNTPRALIIIEEALNYAQQYGLYAPDHNNFVKLLQGIDDLLGLDVLNSTPDIANELKELVTHREQARAQKDWPKSDSIRKELSAHGITVRDTPDGGVWERL